MQGPVDRSRRRFLFQTGAGVLAAASLPAWLRAMEMHGMPKLAPNRASPDFKPDVEIELAARQGAISIPPGQLTRVQHYTGKLLSGPKDTLTELPSSYLGPLIRLHKGQKVRIHLRNDLMEPSITHWHGLHVPALMDGHPMYIIDPGETFVYEFEVINRASLYFYHPHPHEITARQVYYGLAGGLIVNDEEEARLELPSGEYEIPVVLQDRRFNAQNQLIYGPHMHDRMMGFYGDRILVNGLPNAEFEVASRAYRLRFLNGSNARIYKLGWSDGTPVTVIGVDGGLLESPETFPYVMLAPGERLDVWADFSGRPKGSELTMRSLPFSGVLPMMAEHMMGRGGRRGMGGGMMGGMGMMGAMGLPVGSDYPLFKIRVTRETGESPRLPSRLAKFDRYTLDDVANPGKPVPIAISESPMAMLLNGRSYAFNDIQPFERIPIDTVQLMEIFHTHGGHGMRGRMMGMMGGRGSGDQSEGQGMGMMGGMGMMFSMAHPIHLHGDQFQVISRTVSGQRADGYATVKEGLVSSGWKDTVLVMPGETVRMIKPFHHFRGVFMYHCHNLEHEDMGMMRDFLIE
ncbi:blue copper oxidase CueO [Methylocaldum marinum]|uniref:Multicopper oxidase CueO n=1 Tax=Methylocaldum marinum TaxID=1432792 RepID=A0A250KYT0_9GAMM|nr:multicopper oxidase domain-containing protein [Methylocaldum marinum]BBA36785.1 blue copper oxidase CueO [Methylocaldum marinum]